MLLFGKISKQHLASPCVRCSKLLEDVNRRLWEIKIIAWLKIKPPDDQFGVTDYHHMARPSVRPLLVIVRRRGDRDPNRAFNSVGQTVDAGSLGAEEKKWNT